MAAVVTACAAAVAVAHAAADRAGLMNVRLGGDAQATRVVVDLDRAVSAKLLPEAGQDRRLVLMLPGAAADPGLRGAGQGLVKSWSVESTGAGARLRLDLAAAGEVRRRFLLPPADGVSHYRYVIDVEARSPERAGPGSPRPRILTAAGRGRSLAVKKVVVIDAGHGGHDPGARGARNWEKDLNLAAALALKARLERNGRYRVVLTRGSDVFVPLESRVRIAQGADADLFISLHSDSGPDPSVSGASVYTLSDKAIQRSQRFVSKDDWFMKASLVGGGVSDILFDLTQRSTRNRSAAFAQGLVGRVDGVAPLLRRSHRDAGFMVLLAPDVPAVLLEMGFVTNAADEEFLADPQQRVRFMNAVGDAIDDYFADTARLASR